MAEPGALDILEDTAVTDVATLRESLVEVHTTEVVDLLGRTGSRRRAVLFRLLPKDRALAVLEALDTSLAKELLGGLRDERVGQLIEDLDPDDRVSLLDELPANVVRKLLLGLSPREHDLTATLLGYPNGSIGGRRKSCCGRGN